MYMKEKYLVYLDQMEVVKVTTINCILSLLNIRTGSIKIFGKDNDNPNSYDIKSKIGVMFQDVAVFE